MTTSVATTTAFETAVLGEAERLGSVGPECVARATRALDTQHRHVVTAAARLQERGLLDEWEQPTERGLRHLETEVTAGA